MMAGYAIRAQDRSTKNVIYWDQGEWISDFDKVEHLYTEPEIDVVFSVVLLNWVSHVDKLELIGVEVGPDGARREFNPQPKKVGFLSRLFGSRPRS